jgi:hypothetical protein
MNSFNTNRHYNFIAGYPKEYYKYFLQNRLESGDDDLIELSRLFKSINGSDDPYEAALKYAKYLLEKGVNILPSSIIYFVERFETLADDIKEFVLQNTPIEHNYFRKDSGSDRIGFLARAQEARTSSSLTPTNGPQSTSLVVPEHLANKLPPPALRNIVELSYLTDQIIKGSQSTEVDSEKYQNNVLKNTHNDWESITPSTRHVEAAEIAKPLIEARTYERFKDIYRVMQYLLMHRPYDKKHRQDLTTENMIDTNPDIVAPGSAVVYTVAGDVIKKNTQTPPDLYSIEPPTRAQDQIVAGSGPIGGSAGTPEGNKLGSTAGRGLFNTWRSRIEYKRLLAEREELLKRREQLQVELAAVQAGED